MKSGNSPVTGVFGSQPTRKSSKMIAKYLHEIIGRPFSSCIIVVKIVFIYLCNVISACAYEPAYLDAVCVHVIDAVVVYPDTGL